MTDPSKYKRPIAFWKRLKQAARRMRREPTKAEEVLWRALRGRLLDGTKFRRQHPIDRFVVDFCCPESKLVVEIDGSIHESRNREDRFRQTVLEHLGYQVIRFRNDDVMTDLAGSLARLRTALREIRDRRPPSPPGPLSAWAERGSFRAGAS